MKKFTEEWPAEVSAFFYIGVVVLEQPKYLVCRITVWQGTLITHNWSKVYSLYMHKEEDKSHTYLASYKIHMLFAVHCNHETKIYFSMSRWIDSISDLLIWAWIPVNFA